MYFFNTIYIRTKKRRHPSQSPIQDLDPSKYPCTVILRRVDFQLKSNTTFRNGHGKEIGEAY